MRRSLVCAAAWPVLAAGFVWGLWQRRRVLGRAAQERRVLQRSLGGLLVLGLAGGFVWGVETALVWLAMRPPRPMAMPSLCGGLPLEDVGCALVVMQGVEAWGPCVFLLSLMAMVFSVFLPYGMPHRTVRFMGILGMAVALVSRAMTL
jgi:hypothetical protein